MILLYIISCLIIIYILIYDYCSLFINCTFYSDITSICIQFIAFNFNFIHLIFHSHFSLPLPDIFIFLPNSLFSTILYYFVIHVLFEAMDSLLFSLFPRRDIWNIFISSLSQLFASGF